MNANANFGVFGVRWLDTAFHFARAAAFPSPASSEIQSCVEPQHSKVPLRNELADFREVPGQRIIKGGEQQPAALRQRDQVEVVPLTVAGHRLEGHRAGTVQIRRQKLVAPAVREQAGQAQGFGGGVEGRQNFLPHPAGPTEDLQQGQLRERGDGEGAAGEEAMRPLVVLVLRDDERSQSVGVEQIGHPSWSVAATSSAVMVTPSLRASGMPWRRRVLAGDSVAARRIKLEAASSTEIFSRFETALTAFNAAGCKSRVSFTARKLPASRWDFKPLARACKCAA